MTETYREEQEANYAEASTKEMIAEAFEEETMESMMDDDSDQEEEPYEMYDDNGGYN